MKRHLRIVSLIGLAALLFTTPAWADSVETWDGRLFEGSVLTGIPDILTMDDRGVAVSIRRTALLEIVFSEGSEIARAVTTTGDAFEDRVLSPVGTLTIRTASGETEIPNDQIHRIRFPYTQTETPTYDTTAHLWDGRSYEGNLAAGFPNTISIEVNGITSNVLVDKIVTIRFGEPGRLETQERTYEGRIVSDLPGTIQLLTKFGEIVIQRLDVERLSLAVQEPAVRAASRSRSGFGLGFKALGQIPMLSAQYRFGAFAFEAGVGLVGGTLAFDALAKICFHLLSDTVQLYGGGGLFGMSGGGLTLFGFEVLAGVELSLHNLGVPISLFGGGDYIAAGGTGVIGYHFGARWNF